MISIHIQQYTCMYIVNKEHDRRTTGNENDNDDKKKDHCLTWNFICKLNWFVVCGLDNTSNLFFDSCNQSDVNRRTSNLLCNWTRGQMRVWYWFWYWSMNPHTWRWSSQIVHISYSHANLLNHNIISHAGSYRVGNISLVLLFFIFKITDNRIDTEKRTAKQQRPTDYLIHPLIQ